MGFLGSFGNPTCRSRILKAEGNGFAKLVGDFVPDVDTYLLIWKSADWMDSRDSVR